MDKFSGFTRMQCGACGVEHYIPTVLYEECVREGPKQSWCCPNGHSRVFGKSAADKLRSENQRLTQRLAEKDDEIADEKRHSATAKRELTRLKNRTTKGVCPCCNHSFQNLARHMKSKHPDAAKAKVVA